MENHKDTSECENTNAHTCTKHNGWIVETVREFCKEHHCHWGALVFFHGSSECRTGLVLLQSMASLLEQLTVHGNPLQCVTFCSEKTKIIELLQRYLKTEARDIKAKEVFRKALDTLQSSLKDDLSIVHTSCTGLHVVNFPVAESVEVN